MRKKNDVAASCVGCGVIVGLFVLIDAAISALVMWIWNAVLVPLFHFPAITFWQTFGLLLLLGMVINWLRSIFK